MSAGVGADARARAGTVSGAAVAVASGNLFCSRIGDEYRRRRGQAHVHSFNPCVRPTTS